MCRASIAHLVAKSVLEFTHWKRVQPMAFADCVLAPEIDITDTSLKRLPLPRADVVQCISYSTVDLCVFRV